MGDTAQKVMSIINKIAYKRRTLKSKSLVAKHGLWVVVGLVSLGLIIGITGTFVYFEGQRFLTDLNKGSRIVVHAAVQATPKANASVQSDAQVEEKSSTSAEELADKIFALESSRGKNDYCKTIGKVNGYGYRQNAKERVCFNFHEEVKELVEGWVANHQTQGLTEAQLLCHYNTGQATDDCDYYQKSLLIK